MKVRKTWKTGDLFVQARIVFHRAGTKGEDPLIYTIIQPGKVVEMADHLHFGDLGKGRRFLSQKLPGKIRGNRFRNWNLNPNLSR
jgi:hypothetical protein